MFNHPIYLKIMWISRSSQLIETLLNVEYVWIQYKKESEKISTVVYQDSYLISILLLKIHKLLMAKIANIPRQVSL